MSTSECNPGCLPEPENYSRVNAEFMSIVVGVAISLEKFTRYGFNVVVFLPTWPKKLACSSVIIVRVK